jgi:hypothetical protein
MLESTIPIAGPLQVRIANTDTDLDCLRDDPRFQKMMDQARKRVGMEQPKAATSPA